jgi:predicted extracellular nuclease
MKKNFILHVLCIFLMTIFTALFNNISAQTNCTSSKNDIAYAPKASANVVINEVYGGSESGGVYNADFIELYNLSDTPVNISDYSVQYYTAGQTNGGAPTSTAHIPDATILAGNSYYVIRVSLADRAGIPLPCENLNASASFAETGIASDGGKLVLSSTGADLADCTSTLNVVDRVGYGITPVVCNETANAGQPSTSTTIQRRAGANDTDNNSADFTAFSTPTPCAPQVLVPTAAMVNVGGRVTNAHGRSISKTLIRMTDSAGAVRTTFTSSFGYYNFAGVEVGQTLFFDVKAKSYNFTEPTKVVSLNGELINVNFTAY